MDALTARALEHHLERLASAVERVAELLDELVTTRRQEEVLTSTREAAR